MIKVLTGSNDIYDNNIIFLCITVLLKCQEKNKYNINHISYAIIKYNLKKSSKIMQ